MRLLVVMTSYPFPPRAGSAIVAYNNIKEISKKHSVYFICLDVAKELGGFVEFVEQIEFVRPKKVPRFIKSCRCVFYMLLGIPVFTTERMSRPMRKRVTELIERDKFDAILLYNLETIQYCPPSFYDKAIVILEELSSITFRLQRELSVYSLWKKTKLFVYEKLAGNYERKMLPRVAKVLMLSQAGAITAQQKGHNNIRHITYGIEHQQNIFDIGHRSDKMIVFTGNMYHLPNVDGAISFLLKIFPFILESCPLAKLWIVGARPDRRICKAAKSFGDSVVITGQVESVYYYLARAMVSVCPVRLKVGPQTKVLESLSFGTPVVATSASNEGVGGLNGVDLWVEDEPIMFAQRVLELLRGVGWQRLSDNGRKLADKFSWERSAMELERCIMSIQTAGDG